MKKSISLIAFMFFILLANSQSLIEEVGHKTCECIQEDDSSKNFNEKYNRCSVREMESYLVSHSSKEKSTKKNYKKLKTYVEKNCEYDLNVTELNETDLKKVSDDACNCIKKIDGALATKNDSIKECIDSKLMLFQMTNMLTKINTDDKSKAIKPKKVNVQIVTGNDSKIYKQVEKELLNNCDYLRSMLMTNNSYKNTNSLSMDKEAMKNYNIGSTFMKEKNYEKAIEFLNKAVEMDDNFAFAWDNLGLSYRRSGQFEKAVEAYKKSLKADPNGKTPMMNLGVAYESLKKYDDAVVAYDNYIKHLKDDPEGYYGLSRIYMFMKNYDLSMKNVIIALRIYTEQSSPYRTDAINMIKSIYYYMKQEDKVDEFNQLAKKYKLNLN
jgi:tetratricopeptide (TPR) repeat protein